MPVPLHIDAQAVKDDSFGLEAHALFESGFAAKQDFTAGANHALPRHSIGLVQRPGDLAGGAGESGGIGDVAVGRDLAFWNPPDLAQDQIEH